MVHKNVSLHPWIKYFGIEWAKIQIMLLQNKDNKNSPIVLNFFCIGMLRLSLSSIWMEIQSSRMEKLLPTSMINKLLKFWRPPICSQRMKYKQHARAKVMTSRSVFVQSKWGFKKLKIHDLRFCFSIQMKLLDWWMESPILYTDLLKKVSRDTFTWAFTILAILQYFCKTK